MSPLEESIAGGGSDGPRGGLSQLSAELKMLREKLRAGGGKRSVQYNTIKGNSQLESASNYFWIKGNL